MSFQVPPTPPAKGARRGGLLGLGVVLLLGGVGTGAALYITSDSQYEDAVKNLQRAPVGCDTEFRFSGTGTFIFYAESKGKIGDLRGDCENTDTDYSHKGKIDVDLTLTNSDGDEVDLESASGASYDAGGFKGSEISKLELDDTGTYTLSVSSDDTDFAIAVGRNPKDDADSLKTIAIAAVIAGVVLGLLFIGLGMRRKPAAPATGAWNPAGGGNIPGYQPPSGPPPVAPPTAPSQPAWQPVPPPPQQPPSPAQVPPPPPTPPAPAPGSPWGSPQP